jgi:hypothetical protein
MPYRPRAERDRERIHAITLATQNAKAPAMDRALAQIGAAFGEAAAINEFKLRVEYFVRLGPRHAAVRARFGARAALLADRGLDAAIAAAERWFSDERKAFQIASALGCGNRLSLQVLRELRLVLRLMRLKRMQVDFVAILYDEPMPMAAE